MPAQGNAVTRSASGPQLGLGPPPLPGLIRGDGGAAARVWARAEQGHRLDQPVRAGTAGGGGGGGGLVVSPARETVKASVHTAPGGKWWGEWRPVRGAAAIVSRLPAAAGLRPRRNVALHRPRRSRRSAGPTARPARGTAPPEGVGRDAASPTRATGSQPARPAHAAPARTWREAAIDLRGSGHRGGRRSKKVRRSARDDLTEPLATAGQWGHRAARNKQAAGNSPAPPGRRCPPARRELPMMAKTPHSAAMVELPPRTSGGNAVMNSIPQLARSTSSSQDRPAGATRRRARTTDESVTMTRRPPPGPPPERRLPPPYRRRTRTRGRRSARGAGGGGWPGR